MHARHRSLYASIVLLLGLLVVALVSTGTAEASTPTSGQQATAGAGACVKPKPRNDDTIHIQGCLSDQRKLPAKPVADVKISVLDSSGKEVGKGTSNASGVFDIALPGKSIDALGNTYTVKIDRSSLPKGTKLRNAKQVSLKLTPKIDSDIFVTFPIGKAATGESTGVQVLQLSVTGLVFGLVLAMGSLGLSMIFGTTGLTNFAHGELITFGALAAYAVDKLPGDITIGG